MERPTFSQYLNTSQYLSQFMGTRIRKAREEARPLPHHFLCLNEKETFQKPEIVDTGVQFSDSSKIGLILFTYM